MSYFKVFIAGMVTASSMGLATAGYANGVDQCRNVPDPEQGRIIVDAMQSVIDGPIECFERRDNGFGNGDQAAPGQSLENNNAENACGGDGEPACYDADGNALNPSNTGPGNSSSNGNG